MKLPPPVFRLLGIAALGILITGCFLKPATVTTRRFVLTSVQATGRARETNQLTVGLGQVKLPDYLLKDAMAVRRGENEIEYLENALWAERLDHSFQLAVAASLSAQLPDSRVRLSTWRSGEVMLIVRVSVDRLDVDTQGLGTLIARWEVETADAGKILKSGETTLTRPGPAPFANPATIATTLSDLTAQFGEKLAQAVRECAAISPAR